VLFRSETQFAFLRPKHSRSKHRFYETRDIETLRLVKRLLHTEGYTIAGARKHITDLGLDRLLDGTSPTEVEPSPPVVAENHADDRIGDGSSMRGRLTEIRDDLRSLHKLLEH